MKTKLPAELKQGDKIRSNAGPLTVTTVGSNVELMLRQKCVIWFSDGSDVIADVDTPVEMW